MADLASLYIKVDSKGVVTASKDLDNLTGKSKGAEKATESVTRSFSKLQAVVVALASSYALLKMAQYIKDAALLAARYETLGVVMRVVGNNAGYTGAQMEKFARGLQKSGIAMVESRNTLARMIQAQIDLTNSQKLARIAQDAAVIGNLNSSEAFEHMIYGLQTGMPRILRTIGLNVDFNASVKALAVSLGIKKDALSKAQIMQGRVNAVMKAGVLITGTYEAAMGTAGKKLTSFTRYVEDFKVKMGEAFGPATVMLVDAATEAMKEFQDEISRPEAQKALRDLSSQLATTIIQLGQDLPKAIKSTTNVIADIQTIYNSLPPGVVGAAGAGLIGRILFGGWGPAKIVAGLYLINEGMSSIGSGLGDIVKSYKESVLYFGKAWDEIIGKTVKGLEFYKISMDKFLSQYEKMQEMLAKGTPIRLDFALEDPDKYFGKMKAELLAWEKEGFESIKKWYKSIETLAQENLDSMIEIEDQETRMFEENLAYRFIVQKQYYKDIETAAQEARDFEEEMEDEALRMAREAADYKKELANEATDYINKLAEAASYYKDLIGFEETYHDKMLELIEAEAEARAKATGDDVAAAKWAAQEKGRLEQKLFEDKTKYIDEGFSALASSFSDIASLYDKGSDAAKKWEEASKAMEIAQRAVAVVNAVATIANQGLGDPYTAFARIAAMVAVMGALLASIGESVGGGGGASTVPVLPKSTVLGAEAGTGSESVQNVYDLLKDNNAEECNALRDIYNEIQDLNQNITGLVTSMIKGVGGTFGTIDTQVGEWVGKAEGIFNKFLNSIHREILGFMDIFRGITDWVNNLIGGWLGDIFGGGGYTELLRAGIEFRDIDFGKILEGFAIEAFAYAKMHEHEEGGLFHSDKDRYWTEYKDIDEDVIRLLTQIFKNIGDSFVSLAEGLGADVQAIYDYVIPLTQLDLTGMNAEEINEAVTGFFSSLTDTMAEDLFGDIIKQYQEVGEGLFETAIRLVMQKEIILEALKMTGRAFEGTAQEAVDFSQALIEIAGDFEVLMDAFTAYHDAFFTDAEKQIQLYEKLTEAFGDLDLDLPDTRQGFRSLVEGLDLTTESGMETYVALLKLAEASGIYYDTLEDNLQAIVDAQRKPQAIIAERELTDYQRQIQATEEWRDAQLAAWSELEDYMDSTEYLQGIANILKAFGYLLEDIEDQITQTIINIENDLNKQLAQLTMSPEEYQQYLIESQYQATIAQLIALEEETGRDLLALIDLARQLRDVELEALEEQKKALEEQKKAAEAAEAAAERQREYARWDAANALYFKVLAEAADTTEARKSLRAIDDKYQNVIDRFADLGIYLWDYISHVWTEEEKKVFEALNLIRDREIEALRQSILDSQQRLIDMWGDAAQQIEDQINEMKLTSASPEDAQQRMALLKTQIQTMTGGDLAAYIASFETPEEKIAAMNKIREMWAEYLKMAQGVYQRPSDEYQAIYDKVLKQLELMKDIAIEYQSQEQLLMDQLIVLTDIRDLIALFEGLGSYQSGTDYVPKTGLYELHVGEQVIPVKQRNYDGPQVSFTVNVAGSGKPKETAKEIRKEMESFMISGIGRKLVQNTARGH